MKTRLDFSRSRYFQRSKLTRYGKGRSTIVVDLPTVVPFAELSIFSDYKYGGAIRGERFGGNMEIPDWIKDLNPDYGEKDFKNLWDFISEDGSDLRIVAISMGREMITCEVTMAEYYGFDEDDLNSYLRRRDNTIELIMTEAASDLSIVTKIEYGNNIAKDERFAINGKVECGRHRTGIKSVIVDTSKIGYYGHVTDIEYYAHIYEVSRDAEQWMPATSFEDGGRIKRITVEYPEDTLSKATTITRRIRKNGQKDTYRNIGVDQLSAFPVDSNSYCS